MSIFALVSEANALGVLLHFATLPGAYTRGATETEALAKAKKEVSAYCLWAGIPIPDGVPTIEERIIADISLRLDDADSEILLDCDRNRLDASTFEQWCGLAIHSAACFEVLYERIHDKNWVQPEKLRPTFHRKTPATAHEMLMHVDCVSDYYLSNIGLQCALIDGRLKDNRKACIEVLRTNRKHAFQVYENSGEHWSETKVLRRFIWHDRIHAKALYRHGLKMGMAAEDLADVFQFGEE